MHEEKKIEIEIPKRLDQCVQESLDQLRMEQKRKKRKKGAKLSVSAAAACAAITILCVKQPAWAQNIPLLGNIFSYLKESERIPEDFSQHAQPVKAAKTAESDREEKEDTLSQTKNGITITLSEAVCTKNTLYMTVMLEKEGGFQATKETVNAGGIFSCSVGEKDAGMAVSIDGTIVDKKMVGMLAFDMSHIWGNEAEIPDAFDSNISMQILHLPDESDTDRYPDTWDFSIAVKRDPSIEQTIEVNEQNEEGYGIAWVKKNPYELSAKVLQPSDSNTTLIWCDANGALMQNVQSPTDTVVQTQNHDVSKVYVFVCDYDTYLEEKEAYAKSRDAETYAEFMSQHCKYQKVIDFTKN
ncbi:MAG: DUF4179 domain-containing protein [Lachnospiraceae bacterium]